MLKAFTQMKAQAAAEEEAKKAAKERWTVDRTIVESSSIIMVFKTFRGTYLSAVHG